MSNPEAATITSLMVFEFLCRVHDASLPVGNVSKPPCDPAVVERAHASGLLVIHSVSGLKKDRQHETYTVTPLAIATIERQRRRGGWLKRKGNHLTT